KFVLLDNRLEKETMSSNAIGLARLYKPVTVGSTLGATTVQNFTYFGKAWKPYSPVHICAERDGSGNITLSWVRRSRVGGGWRDSVDVPLHESSERYEIEVLDGESVVRTMQVTMAEASYSVSEQTIDFGSAQSSVSVRIYQISDVIGRGYPGEAVV
ncbi:MAG: hypothetical protein ACPG80_03170, partial [Rickettsiales bacterium]